MEATTEALREEAPINTRNPVGGEAQQNGHMRDLARVANKVWDRAVVVGDGAGHLPAPTHATEKLPR